VFKRLLDVNITESLLLLGPRGTGKSTYLRERLRTTPAFWINLLLPKTEDAYARDPERLIREVTALPDKMTHIVIDEIQKVTPLLDVVHELIETTHKTFVLTGSSARKLKAGSANLLAGRALVHHLYPLTSNELGSTFDLSTAMKFGTLPRIWNLKTDSARRKMLETYALTYLNEEIRAEQVVRNLDPFRKFLEVAAQMNGRVINFSAISDDVGVDEKTVQNYFQILEDTLVGFFIEPFHTSVRKKISKSPKFYFFDTGVKRALARQLTLDLVSSTYEFGDLFEHFVILEINRWVSYSGNQFSLNYLRTYEDAEIDLVVQRPGKSLLLVGIKSTDSVQRKHLKQLVALGQDFPGTPELLCLSNDPGSQVMENVLCLHWQQGLKRFFSGPDLKV